MAADARLPLLIEIGTEELPPKALDELAAAFAAGLADELDVLHVEHAAPTVYCSPRRLCAHFAWVAEQKEVESVQFGPPVSVGFDKAGAATPALLGFAKKVGVDVGALQRDGEGKNEKFVYRSREAGKPLATLLPGVIERALKRLPIPKPMRWGDHDYTFVRPAHWLVVLHGDRVVDASLLGLVAGRDSRGHRFHHPQAVPVANADAWLAALREAKVLADPAERRARVRAEVARVAKAIGGEPRLSDALCDEIANLTEWPVAMACAFEREFLAVPQEALVTTMETNQKFVPVFDASGALTEHFIGVANIDSKDPAEIRKGYERVIRPRFADAKFFFDEDLKTPLAAQQEALKSVTYQQSLGSVWDKTVRVAELARVIAGRLSDAGIAVDAGEATRAAALAKCDLMTRMVGEFPELQGVMGRYYARAAGEREAVALALDAFYQPRFAGDAIASGRVGQVLAVAERLDTLAGIFAVGMKPSGNKDPFALRRAALGLARALIEAGLPLDLRALLTEALQLLPDTALAAGLPKAKDGKQPALDAGVRRTELERELYDFVLDRLRGYYADRGISAEAFEAVRALAPADLTDFDQRLRAVVAFAALPQAQALAAANKRIGNILRQAGDAAAASSVDAALLEAGAEAELAAAIDAAARRVGPLAAERRYDAILTELASLREPVDRFFDGVMVMVDDAPRRANRLALLRRLRTMFLDVADISVMPADSVSGKL